MQAAIRNAVESDLSRLMELESESFSSDRLSRRSFRNWIKASHGILLVAEEEGMLIAYGLGILHKGTRLGRLYSLAVHASARGQGLGKRLVQQIEQQAAERGRLYMRLEVDECNQTAIDLYKSMGYRIFGVYPDYYESHHNALRMQKRIRFPSLPHSAMAPVPWFQQSTPFTCGPAALMMAMASLDASMIPTRETELDIWREATTIFMTSGHGGCHPIGLALAAQARGCTARVILNRKGPLFLEGVRSLQKKEIMTTVDRQFRQRAKESGIEIAYSESPLQKIEKALQAGKSAIVLISTYRTTGSKAPHWVTVTSMDDLCLYVNDPDPSDNQTGLDCQHIPIARDDFAKMSVYGNNRLRTAVIIGR
ncbi:MAG: peptidase C39 family protein [Pontiellaceae bacterium]|nr:peptidase C39 family protein [Pontiellaceae bacterium]MBN2786436.1 peptidase C39 family protein [Pontiellaceae bacterium]